MKPFPIQFLAIPVLLVTALAIVFTARSKPEENTLSPKQASPTRSRARKDTSAVTTLLRTSSRKDFLTENGDPIQENAETTDALLTEFWQEKLSQLHRNDRLSDRELGKQLTFITLNPQAPDQVRVEAMMDALVFIDDENYNQDIKPLAIRTNLPEAINDVILEDLLGRPPLSVLPVAREIAKVGGHPLADAFDAYVKSVEDVNSTAD